MDHRPTLDQPLVPTAFAARSLGLPAIVVIESGLTDKEAEAHIRAELGHTGFDEAFDVGGLLSGLANGRKVFYIEHGQKLDERVETLIVDYAAGVASFPALSVSGRFTPANSSCVIALSRAALEASYPELLEYAGAVVSLD